MRTTYLGPWADTPGSAVAVAASDTNVDDWLRVDYAEGCAFVSPDDTCQVDVEVRYSEARDQYRAMMRLVER